MHLLFLRIENYQKFKNFEKRLMVATDLFGRGMDIERVNIVINYDMPDSTDAYLHRVRKIKLIYSPGWSSWSIWDEGFSYYVCGVERGL